MQTHSECLVHHLGPQALWHRDLVQWLTPSPPASRSPTPNPGGFSLAFSRLIQKEITCLIFPSSLREICVMWFQRNNPDNSRIYPWVLFGLFTHVSSSPFLSFFLPSIPLPISLQESCNVSPLHLSVFCSGPSTGWKRLLRTLEEKRSPSKVWLGFLCLLCLAPKAQAQSEDLEELAITISQWPSLAHFQWYWAHFWVEATSLLLSL